MKPLTEYIAEGLLDSDFDVTTNDINKIWSLSPLVHWKVWPGNEYYADRAGCNDHQSENFLQEMIDQLKSNKKYYGYKQIGRNQKHIDSAFKAGNCILQFRNNLTTNECWITFNQNSIQVDWPIGTSSIQSLAWLQINSFVSSVGDSNSLYGTPDGAPQYNRSHTFVSINTNAVAAILNSLQLKYKIQ